LVEAFDEMESGTDSEATEIPDSEHLARYCGGAQIDEDGNPNGVAFRPRPGEDYLSVNWLEYISPCCRQAQLTGLREVLSRKLRIGATARIAVANCGNLRQHVESVSVDSRRLYFLHHPEPDDPSHAGVHNIVSEDHLVADLMAEACLEVFPARGP
jgi:hypothetical protein